MNTTIAAYINDSVERAEVKHMQLFAGANLSPVDELLTSCPILELSAGKTLVSAGDPSLVMYLVIEGKLRLHQDSLKGASVGFIQAGECFGELSLINRKPSSVFVVADEDTRLLVVDEDRLLMLVNNSHAIARNFLFRLMGSLRVQNESQPEHKRLQEKYQRHSSVDELTGLHNRHWLGEMLTRQIMRSATNREALSIVMLDVDNFGEFNRDFGKVSGDQALYTVAQSLMASARPTDLIARCEDDSFIMVLADTDMDGAKVLAERVKTAISATKVVVPNECILPPVTVSLGVVQMKSFVAAEKLLQDAAVTLARAKEMGGNSIAE